MATIKTAISIDESIFNQMEALAKKSKLSRSRLFAKAASEFIKRNENLDLLEKLNEVYHDPQESEELGGKLRDIHYRLVKDQW